MNASFEPKSQDPKRRTSHREIESAAAFPSRTIVHAKLEMTSPGDRDEQEADAVANEVVSGGKIARKISGGGGSSGIAVSRQMESRLLQQQGGGQPMPSGLLSKMESSFGRDLSQVRLHTDSNAVSMSSSIHARAFTHGNDIYFNRGQFSPETTAGQHLVAHELTHVVQGTGKVGREKDNNVKVDSSEHEAMIVEDYRESLNVIAKTIAYLDTVSQSFTQQDVELFKRWFDIDIINEGKRLFVFRELLKAYQTMSEEMTGNEFSFITQIPDDYKFSADALAFTKSGLTEEELTREKHTVYIPYRNGMDSIKKETLFFGENADIQNYFGLANRNNRIRIIIHELAHRILGANFANQTFDDSQNRLEEVKRFNDKNIKFTEELYGSDADSLSDKKIAGKNRVQRWKRDYGNDFYKYALQNADTIALFALNVVYPEQFKK